MLRKSNMGKMAKLLAGFFAGSFVIFAPYAGAAGDQAEIRKYAIPSATTLSQRPSEKVALLQSSREWQSRQSLYYKRNWGIDVVGVHPVTSGYMLAFRYRVLDPNKAKQLNDRQIKAYIVDEASGIKLAVPSMENVGDLRSGTSPEAGRTYFMIFGNPGKLVKAGSRVSVVVGNFSVEGLVVD
jgi:hypothetical protein